MLITTIRQHRRRAGLSQSALAEHVGVSRQALSAIEAGRQVPSTLLSLQFARALGVRVDELFRLADSHSVRARLAAPAKANERVVVGRVGAEWVAHPLVDETRAADGVIESGGDAGQHAVVELLATPRELEQNLLVAGCAPLIGALADRLRQRFREARATWIPANSTQAMALLRSRFVHVAGVHLAESGDVGAHRSAARSLGSAATLVHLARWKQGVVAATDNPLAIRSARDLTRPGLRLARREEGAAAEFLLKRILGEHDTAESRPPLAGSHADVARLVKWGVADAGIAIEASAIHDGLSFVPLSEERFDLIVPKSVLERQETTRFIEAMTERSFQRDVSAVTGYDLRDAGQTYDVGQGEAS